MDSSIRSRSFESVVVRDDDLGSLYVFQHVTGNSEFAAGVVSGTGELIRAEQGIYRGRAGNLQRLAGSAHHGIDSAANSVKLRKLLASKSGDNSWILAGLAIAGGRGLILELSRRGDPRRFDNAQLQGCLGPSGADERFGVAFAPKYCIARERRLHRIAGAPLGASLMGES